MLIAHLVLERIKAQQHPHSECRTGTKSRAGRQIRNVMYFDPVLNVHELETGTHRRMFYRAVVGHVLDSRIGNPAVIFEEGRQAANCNVAALVDSSRQNRAPVLSVPNGIIGASTEE